jgi:SNF2 family DNA or RNA helicase
MLATTTNIIKDPDTGAWLCVWHHEPGGMIRFQPGGKLNAQLADDLYATPGAHKGSRWFSVSARAFRVLMGPLLDADEAPQSLPTFSGDWGSHRALIGGEVVGLRPYQVEGCAWIARSGLHGLLGDEMGLGKTVQVLAALESARGDLSLERALVVATTSTVYNWAREAERWAPSWPVRVIASARQADAALRGGGIVVTTWGLLSNLQDKLAAWSPESLIADEAHYASGGYGTQRGRALISLAGVASSTLLMTGTPLTNRPRDLWPLLHALYPERFPAFGPFGSMFCDPQQVWVGTRQVTRYDGATEQEYLAQILSEIMLRRRKADVLLELPERIEVVVPVQVAARARSAWRDARKSIWSNEGPDALVQIGEAWRAVGEAKVPAAAEYIESLIVAQEGPVIALVHHSEVRRALQQQLGKAGLRVAVIVGETPAGRRAELVDAYQRGEYDVMIGSMALCEGVTLTRARHVVQVEWWWTEASMDQGHSRAHRMGQEREVVSHYLSGIGTVDEHIQRLVRRKRSYREDIVEASTQAAAMQELVLQVSREQR